MIERMRSECGVVVYVSPLLRALGVAHGFSTRIGGVSPAPFDSMNLGNPSGCALQDEDARIQENYRRLQAAIGCSNPARCWVHQVHGAGVELAPRGTAWTSGRKADAIVSDDPSRVLAVRVADCVPALIAADGGRMVAAVHAGWRGVVADVAAAAVRRMREWGAASGFVAAIGPCIGRDAFEVGEDVAEEFRRTLGERSVERDVNGKAHVDLREAVRRQLSEAGVEWIDTTDRCTVRDGDEFFSHRRDRGVTGRMAALIAAKGQ